MLINKKKMINIEKILIQLLAILTLWPSLDDCLIITSVLAGDKKFKTISFDTKFLKPLTFTKEMPTTEFRRYRVVRPPKFDIDINIPIKLPLEDEYPQEEKKKPVVNNIFFQTSEIAEPSSYKKQPETSTYINYENTKKTTYPKKKVTYTDDMRYSASSQNQMKQLSTPDNNNKAISQEVQQQQPEFDDAKVRRHSQIMMTDLNVAASNQQQQQLPAANLGRSNIDPNTHRVVGMNSRADVRETQEFPQQQQQQVTQESLLRRNYAQPAPYYNNYEQKPDFIPGGFINLQLSGPNGPKATYEDYDREKWNQQVSQAASAMPYPVLNYHQLQNFYGGLGTFTNGIPDNRYAPDGLLDKLMSGISHITSKFHLG